MSDFLTTPQGRKLAYNKLEGQGPTVVFLGGFKSDKEGTKALALEDWARAQGRAFLRFDYSGHGASSGDFEEGCIGDWALDAREAIQSLTTGPLVLVGSSMGGWISLLTARIIPERIHAMVTIAAAPDFTENGFWPSFSEVQRSELMEAGRLELPSEYSDEPYVITRRLIEDGRNQQVLTQPLHLQFPVRFLQGTADEDVPMDWALNLMAHASGDDLRLTLVKGADHRFSSPECLALIEATLAEVLAH